MIPVHNLWVWRMEEGKATNATSRQKCTILDAISSTASRMTSSHICTRSCRIFHRAFRIIQQVISFCLTSGENGSSSDASGCSELNLANTYQNSRRALLNRSDDIIHQSYRHPLILPNGDQFSWPIIRNACAFNSIAAALYHSRNYLCPGKLRHFLDILASDDEVEILLKRRSYLVELLPDCFIRKSEDKEFLVSCDSSVAHLLLRMFQLDHCRLVQTTSCNKCFWINFEQELPIVLSTTISMLLSNPECFYIDGQTSSNCGRRNCSGKQVIRNMCHRDAGNRVSPHPLPLVAIECPHLLFHGLNRIPPSLWYYGHMYSFHAAIVFFRETRHYVTIMFNENGEFEVFDDLRQSGTTNKISWVRLPNYFDCDVSLLIFCCPVPAEAPLVVAAEKLFCPVCFLKIEENMIQCDGCETWFHLACVGLKIAPVDDYPWLCEICAQDVGEMEEMETSNKLRKKATRLKDS